MSATAPTLSQLIPIMSLIIAALAVFVGPLVTLRIGRKQIELSRRIASKQVVAPMRQAWINTFREKLAELTGNAFHYWYNRPLGAEKKALGDEEQRRLSQLEHEIEFFINPKEADHKELVDAIRQMLSVLERGTEDKARFNPALEKVTMLGQKIFKTEWN